MQEDEWSIPPAEGAQSEEPEEAITLSNCKLYSTTLQQEEATQSRLIQRIEDTSPEAAQKLRLYKEEDLQGWKTFFKSVVGSIFRARCGWGAERTGQRGRPERGICESVFAQEIYEILSRHHLPNSFRHRNGDPDEKECFGFSIIRAAWAEAYGEAASENEANKRYGFERLQPNRRSTRARSGKRTIRVESLIPTR